MYKEKYEECKELYGGGGEKVYFLDSPSSSGCFWLVSGQPRVANVPAQCQAAVKEEAQELRLSLGLGCLVSVLVGLRVGLVLFVVVDDVDVLQSK